MIVESPGTGITVRGRTPGRPQEGEAAASGPAAVPGSLHIAPTGLRRYPPDSAHAAARIVALALISNGRIKSVEAALLDAVEAPAWLGIPRDEWYAVLAHLRLDLQQVNRSRGFSLSGPALERLLEEITDEDLQWVVAALCVAVIHADRRVGPAERAFLAALQRRWVVSVHPGRCALLLRAPKAPPSARRPPGTHRAIHPTCQEHSA